MSNHPNGKFSRKAASAVGRAWSRSMGWITGRMVPWLRLQGREIVGEIRSALRPPVKVRQHGRGALAVSARPEFGGAIVVIPIGSSSVVGVDACQEGGSHEVRVWATHGGDGRSTWSVGRFPNRETAQLAVDIIRKPLIASGWGKWALGLAALWVGVILLRTWMAMPVVPVESSHAAEVGTAVGTGNPGLMGLFGGAHGQSPGAGVSAALSAALAGSQDPSAGQSLADQIYEEAMRQAQVSQREQGPPAAPGPDPGLSGFGLSNGATGEGCDPELAFKVSP